MTSQTSNTSERIVKTLFRHPLTVVHILDDHPPSPIKLSLYGHCKRQGSENPDFLGSLPVPQEPVKDCPPPATAWEGIFTIHAKFALTFYDVFLEHVHLSRTLWGANAEKNVQNIQHSQGFALSERTFQKPVIGQQLCFHDSISMGPCSHGFQGPLSASIFWYGGLRLILKVKLNNAESWIHKCSKSEERRSRISNK